MENSSFDLFPHVNNKSRFWGVQETNSHGSARQHELEVVV